MKGKLAAGMPASAAPVSVARESGEHDSAAVISSAQNQPKQASAQVSFSFEPQAAASTMDIAAAAPSSLHDEIEIAASDYQLQMQAYALAVRELLPSLAGGDLKVTLHFLDPNVEVSLPDGLLRPDVCAEAIDDAMRTLSASLEPEHFPVRPAAHCRMCNFLDICAAGREFVRVTRKV